MRYRDIEVGTLCIVPNRGVVRAEHPTYGTRKNGERVSVYPNDSVFPFKKKGSQTGGDR